MASNRKRRHWSKRKEMRAMSRGLKMSHHLHLVNQIVEE